MPRPLGGDLYFQTIGFLLTTTMPIGLGLRRSAMRRWESTINPRSQTSKHNSQGGGAQFIWSSNLVLDNEVIVRFTASAPEILESTVAKFTVTSDAINNGVLLDAFKCEMKSRVDGSEDSIPLSWSGVPEGTGSIAVTVHHFPNPNETDPTKANHYLQLWDIDPSVSGIPHGMADEGPWFMGANKDNNTISYTSPCSRGGGPGGHAYTITVYALSETPPSLPAASSLDVTYSFLLDAIETVSVLGTASITFTD